MKVMIVIFFSSKMLLGQPVVWVNPGWGDKTCVQDSSCDLWTPVDSVHFARQRFENVILVFQGEEDEQDICEQPVRHVLGALPHSGGSGGRQGRIYSGQPESGRDNGFSLPARCGRHSPDL